MSEISYKTIGGRNFMLIPCTESGKNISTQIRMITSGGMKNILSVTATSKNGVSILQAQQFDTVWETNLQPVFLPIGRNDFCERRMWLLCAFNQRDLSK